MLSEAQNRISSGNFFITNKIYSDNRESGGEVKSRDKFSYFLNGLAKPLGECF